MASGHLLVLVSVITLPPPSTSSLRVNPGHPALVLLVTGLFNLGSSAQAQNAEQAGLLILRNNSLMTQIRLGSQEFPDRKTERSLLCVHASPGLQLRVTPLLPLSLEHTACERSVDASLALRASAISNNGWTFFSIPVCSYHPANSGHV